MKTLITLIIFLLSFNTYSQIKSIKLLQINSEWNLKNDIQRSKLPNKYLAHKIMIHILVFVVIFILLFKIINK